MQVAYVFIEAHQVAFGLGGWAISILVVVSTYGRRRASSRPPVVGRRP
ncbi:MAG: hypothetical protein ACRYG4_01025 [Janthinobacterium lividum]